MRCVQQLGMVCLVIGCLGNTSEAININLNYDFDTSNFFGAGNPDGAAAGAQARASMEAAAGFFSGILDDTFSAIQTPAPFNSSVFDGTVVWQWSLNFTHPATGGNQSLVDETIAADEYRIYVGARSLAGSTLGFGGPGGFGWSSNPSGGFTSGEITQINQITADFSSAVEDRQETSGFSAWGGAVSFDSDAATNWNYDHLSQPAAGESDFYSVALHELGHTLGLGGSSTDWSAWQIGSEFRGPQALAAWKSEDPTASPAATGIPTVSSGDHHWKDNTPNPSSPASVSSFILGSGTLQETAMDPTILSGTRKLFTNVDTLALRDIGWTVPDSVFTIPGDYDGDGDVDSADLARWSTWYGINANGDADGDGDTDGTDFLIWQQNHTGSLPLSATTSVPEPTTLALLVGSMLLCGFRTARR